MKQLRVVVFIWYICVNENYLFTRANDTYTNDICKDANITIHNIAIQDLHLKTNCIGPPRCKLIRTDFDNDIDLICKGSKACLPNNYLNSSCLLGHSSISISYICISNGVNERKYDFEVSSDTNIWKLKNWIWYKAVYWQTIIRPITDHSSVLGDGHFISIESSNQNTGSVEYTMSNGNIKCMIFWYYMKGENIKSFNVLLKRNKKPDETLPVQIIPEDRWIQKSIEIKNGDGEVIKKIVLEAELGPISCVAVDDIIMTMESCSEIVHEHKCLEMNGMHTVECPALFPNFSEIDLKIDPQVNTSDYQCKDTEDQLANFVNESCTLNNSITNTCTFSLDSISEDQKSCLLHRTVHLNYSCTDMSSNSPEEMTTVNNNIDMSSNSPEEMTTVNNNIDMSSNSPEEMTTVNNNIDASSSIATEVQSTEQTGTSMYVTTEKQYISTFEHTDVISPSNLSNSSSVIGIAIGVILPIVVLAVCLVIAVIYVRRSRYSEKKANSIVVEKKNHSDYTGHQNVAFSPEVNVTTQTDYCEIRTSKHNDQYHDISDTFRPLINTINDDEYSEIANVVNSPNSNSNTSTNYQHQYITLDPNATGFDRSIPQNNLHNESKNNQNSNEKTSFTGGDDYAILDPDDLNESQNNTPRVLPLSDNYVVLDPNETGFNRQESTKTVCNYELATSINPTETSEDPYDVSKDETYDTSSNSRHKEKENNIYSHMVDNVYDTAGNQRKKEDNDATYDHFFGQQSEDDYDISKPL